LRSLVDLYIGTFVIRPGDLGPEAYIVRSNACLVSPCGYCTSKSGTVTSSRSSPLSSEDAEFDVSMLEPPPFPGMYLMLEQSRPALFFFFLLRMRAYPCLWFGGFLVS
jgi:hypothetical protein